MVELPDRRDASDQPGLPARRDASGLPDRTPGPPDRLDVRVSNTDRERVASVLHDATAEGRLTLDELDERLREVYTARTYRELAEVTRDLPVAHVEPAVGTELQVRPDATPTSSGAVALLSGFDRRGPWVVPRRFRCLAVLGGGDIDLREATYSHREVRIQANVVLGGITVIVPEDAEVVINGAGILGGFESKASGPGRPGAPRIVITGLAVLGAVEVRRKPPKQDKRRPRGH